MNNLLNGYKFRSGEHDLSSQSFTQTAALRRKFKTFLDVLEKLVDGEVANIGGSVSWTDYKLFYISSLDANSNNSKEEEERSFNPRNFF